MKINPTSLVSGFALTAAAKDSTLDLRDLDPARQSHFDANTGVAQFNGITGTVTGTFDKIYGSPGGGTVFLGNGKGKGVEFESSAPGKNGLADWAIGGDGDDHYTGLARGNRFDGGPGNDLADLEGEGTKVKVKVAGKGKAKQVELLAADAETVHRH